MDTDLPTPNIPLLRKAVEWAEAEAAKTDGTCMWYQGEWVTEWSCGTAYCIAGYAVSLVHGPVTTNGGEVLVNGDWADWEDTGAETLGLTYAEASALFDGGNDIDDVRRAAEQIAARAGERL